MRTLVLMLIVTGALWAAVPDVAQADVVLGPINIPTCVNRPGPCQPVYAPRCATRTHFCRPGRPVYTQTCLNIWVPRAKRPARRSTCLTPCGPCYSPCNGWCGSYHTSRSYPGPIMDFGGRTVVNKRQKPYGRGTGLWYFGCR